MIELDFSLGWKTIVTIIYGTLILRVAGRKSLSQMTVAQTVVMLAVGTVLIEPLVGGVELIDTFTLVAISVATLIAIESSEIKFPIVRKLFTGEPVVLIENGEVKRENLKRVRMTIQQLEMELRQASIAKIADIKWATIEPNGRFGFLLRDELQAIGGCEYQELLHRLEVIEKHFTDTKGKESDIHCQTSFAKEIKDPLSYEDVFKKVALTNKK
ncbi:YetF domain-containing protein [Pelosinus sp. IPA-1]|uniref:DUF421 domain-containing protein n=1 Tax=Pelosinus sp. IPA-1 TaxID=3029569 RepID=UPI002553FD12|nr:YetF domain-containing protein [Pelosinus sp. IPA-1]